MRTSGLIVPILCAFAAVGLYLQFDTYLNHDIAWILYSAGLMLEGQAFGRDIIAPNPPLAWYLSLPPLVAGGWLGVHPATAFRLYAALIALAALGFALWFPGRAAAGGTVWRHRLFVLALGYAFFLGCYRDFGQREYLALALALPYLLLAAGRIGGARHDWRIAVPAGIAAGLGLALKPHFLAVPLAVELAGIAATRRPLFALRAETWAIAATGAAYLAVVLIAAPHYLAETVPMVLPIYWGFDVPLAEVLRPVAAALGGLAVAAIFALRHRPTPLQLTVLAAACGFLAAYVWQMQGYTYHAFPFETLAAAALALAVGQAIDERTVSRAAPRTGAAFAAAAALFLALSVLVGLGRLTLWHRYENLADGPGARATAALIRLVEEEARGERFLALSTHPYPGFPVSLYAQARWGSRTNSRFFLPAIAKLRAAGADADRDALRRAEELAYAFLRRDLMARPRLVLVDAARPMHAVADPGFDLLDFYLADPRIRAQWRSYEELPPLYRYRVFRRREGSAAR